TLKASLEERLEGTKLDLAEEAARHGAGPAGGRARLFFANDPAHALVPMAPEGNNHPLVPRPHRPPRPAPPPPPPTPQEGPHAGERAARARRLHELSTTRSAAGADGAAARCCAANGDAVAPELRPGVSSSAVSAGHPRRDARPPTAYVPESETGRATEPRSS